MKDPDLDPTTGIFFSDSSPLRDSAKNDKVLYSMTFQKCIGPNVFSWIRYYVAEVCALPSALLVVDCYLIVSFCKCSCFWGIGKLLFLIRYVLVD